jgi:hypothetical protein
MILASGDTKSIPRTPAEVSVTNISRIPSTICKQLFKLKAKFQTSTADTRNFPSHSGSGTSSLLTVPDGYALVEFFGTHDFGWVKQDTMIPMLLNGSFGGQGGKIGIYLHDFTC